MKNLITLILFGNLLVAQVVFGQGGQNTKGKITRNVEIIVNGNGNTPRPNPLDPNGDGWITFGGAQNPFSYPTNGFSYDYTSEFEFDMFGLPSKNGGSEVVDDVGCSAQTELIPDFKGFAVYSVIPDYSRYPGQYNYGKNLIFRWRITREAPANKAFHILVDTDGLFGANDPDNYSPPSTNSLGNYGFELDISYDKQSLIVYSLGAAGCLQTLLSLPAPLYSQESIADLEGCGNEDVFVDFYIPLANLENLPPDLAFSPENGLRFVAVTNNSNGCAVNGVVDDINGINDNVIISPETGMDELLNAQCPTYVGDICETCIGFSSGPDAPTVNTPIKQGAKVISGEAMMDPGYPLFIKVQIRDCDFSSANGGSSVNCGLTYTYTKEILASGPYTVAIDGFCDGCTTKPFAGGLTPGDELTVSALYSPNGTACDANASSIVKVIVVVEPNVAPLAFNGSSATNEDTELIIDMNKNRVGSPTLPLGEDPDGDELGYRIVINNVVQRENYFDELNPISFTTFKGGSIICKDIDCKSISYTPPLNYFSGDQDYFFFIAYDGGLDSPVKQFFITINEVNDRPVADDQTLTVTEDIPRAIILTGSDVENSPLTYVIVQGPQNGTLSGSGSSRTYTPNPNFNGEDSFTFTVSDGELTSLPATISLSISPVNDLPIAGNDEAEGEEDSTISLNILGNDTDVKDAINDGLIDPSTIDLDPLTPGQQTTFEFKELVNATPVLRGTFSIIFIDNITSGDIQFIPVDDWFGLATANYTVQDNEGATSNQASIIVTVISVNDAPVASDDSNSTTEDVNIIVSAPGVLLNDTDIEKDALSVIQFQIGDQTFTAGSTATIIVDGKTIGSFTLNANGSYSLLLEPNANGTLPEIFYTVSDGNVSENLSTYTDIAKLLLDIQPVNDTPQANADEIATPEDTAVDIILTGSDVDLDELTFELLTQPQHGVLSGSLPNLTYDPFPNYFGPDSFTFRVNDGLLNSLPATVSIIVSPVNDAPVALDETVVFDAWVQPDSAVPVDFKLDASDTESSSLTYTLIGANPLVGGTISGVAPNLTFTPAEGFSGVTSFTFKVNDGELDSEIATVTILVRGEQLPPQAFPATYSVNEDTNLNIVLRASDPNGDALTYTITTPPATGTITGTPALTLTDIGPIIVYSPGLNVNGQITFTFTAKDSFGNVSNTALITINITPINDAPSAIPQTITLPEDTPTNITLSGSDIEGSSLSYTILTNPLIGKISGSPPNIVYTPDTNFNGSDSFTFKVNDGSLDSSPATISLTITPVNDRPVANGQTIFTNEDTPTPLFLLASDIEGDRLTFSVVKQPTNGALSCSNCANPTYIPAANYFGPDNFTFEVSDGLLTSNVATVNINVSPINDAPVALNQTSVSTLEDTPKNITLTGTDIDQDPLTFSIISQPVKGTLSGSAPNLVYTPDPNFFGEDQFTFRANDGRLNSNTATIIITVEPVNDVPVADAQNLSTNEDTALNITLTGSDIDLDALNFIINNPSSGTLSGTAPNLIYTPNLNFNGSDSFTFKVTDGLAESPLATISISVVAVNDSPVAVDISTSVIEDNSKSIVLSASDNESDALSYRIVTMPLNGMVVLQGSSVVYSPRLNFTGQDSFTYRANDGGADSNTATVSITVTPVNDAPVIQPVTTTEIKEDTEGQICIAFFDIDGDELSVDLPENISGGGTIRRDVNNSSCFIFKSDLNYNGDSFWKIRICDNGNPQLCSERQFQIVVAPVNDVPVANDDELTVRSYEESEIVNLLTNDTDVENDQLFLTTTPVEAPAHGIITMSQGGGVQYKSELGYIGTDRLVYEVCDTGAPKLCTTATLTINVVPPKFRIFEGLSPNNDGLNDYWRLNGIEDYPQNRVQIFDRYNNLVYDIRGYDNESNNWRGQANVGVISGNLPDGTYFYIIEINDGNGPYSGFVVLKRN